MSKIKKYNYIIMFVAGLLIGILSRLLDIYSQNIGNIFSQMSIWILFGTLISIYSNTKKRAMLNIFLFCIGMYMSYYSMAVITNGVYNNIFIIGWTIFAFCSPIFAFFTWLTKEKGVLPKLIGLGIVLVSLLSSIILFDKLRIYDFIINGVLVYYIFLKKN